MNRRLKVCCLSTPFLVILVSNSGCGLIGAAGDAVGGIIVERYSDRLDDKLKTKYGVLPEDDAKVIAKKMFSVESKDNPTLAANLLAVGPEAWDELIAAFKEKTTLREKLTAGVAAFKTLTDSFEKSKDENGSIKWASGGTGTTLLLFILALINKYRKDRKAKTDLVNAIENPVVDAKPDGTKEESVKKAVALTNNTDLNNFITELHPKEKVAA